MAPETPEGIRERLRQAQRESYVDYGPRITGERTQREKETEELATRLGELEREERRRTRKDMYGT